MTPGIGEARKVAKIHGFHMSPLGLAVGATAQCLSPTSLVCLSGGSGTVSHILRIEPVSPGCWLAPAVRCCALDILANRRAEHNRGTYADPRTALFLCVAQARCDKMGQQLGAERAVAFDATEQSIEHSHAEVKPREVERVSRARDPWHCSQINPRHVIGSRHVFAEQMLYAPRGVSRASRRVSTDRIAVR